MLHQRRFKAMGTDVGVWLWSELPDAASAVEAMPGFFEEVEQELSRFRPTSALCRLNAAAGQGPQPVPARLHTLIRLAIEKARATGGLFDPTILPALQIAGYNATFGDVAARSEAEAAKLASPPRPTGPRWREIELHDRAIALPGATAIDLGGIAKGWTVDQAAEQLAPWGPAMVDAGGDIRCTGPVAGRNWPVGIADPRTEGRDVAFLELGDEAVATSSIGRRRWKLRGQWMHHVIDPRTQSPTETDVLTASVVGPTAMDSEIHTKVVMLEGSQAGVKYLEARGLSGLLVLVDGSIRIVGDRMARAQEKAAAL